MFNTQVFLSSLLIGLLSLVAIAGCVTAVMHRWWPMKIAGAIVFVVALSLAIGVAAA